MTALEPHRGRFDGLRAYAVFIKVHTHAVFVEKYLHSRRALRDITGRPTKPENVPIAVNSNGVVHTDSRSTSRGDILMWTPRRHWMKLRETAAGSKASEDIYNKIGF
jgi:hypothetical protein